MSADNPADRRARWVVAPGGAVDGEVRVPGDKSVSHRALMLGGIAHGVTTVEGFLASEDCLATLKALRLLGVPIEQPTPTSVHVHGVGPHGLQGVASALDMGNAGTAMRLFMGLLSGQRFDSVLVGDASLMRRPMERAAAPLRAMGARIETREGKPPVVIRGNSRLTGIDFSMPVASAQVKSAVLLAGLYADGETRVTEPAPTREPNFGQQLLARTGREPAHLGHAQRQPRELGRVGAWIDARARPLGQRGQTQGNGSSGSTSGCRPWGGTHGGRVRFEVVRRVNSKKHSR